MPSTPFVSGFCCRCSSVFDFLMSLPLLSVAETAAAACRKLAPGWLLI
jgi:hypothetical protein